MEKTHYERIIVGTEEEKHVALKELQRLFEEKPDSLVEYESEKTPEDIELINRVISIVGQMVEKYGGDIKPFPIDKIFIIKPDGIKAMSNGRISGGIHKPLGLSIGAERKESNILLGATIAHELFHLKSYKSARVGKDGKDVRLYRSGMTMIDRKNPEEEGGEEKAYFSRLEEAIVAECTKIFLEEIRDEQFFDKETKALERIKKWLMDHFRRNKVSEEVVQLFLDELKYIPNPEEIVNDTLSYSDDDDDRSEFASGWIQRLHKEKQLEWIERYQERKAMYDLLDLIVEKSGDEFKTRDELFDKLARANFTGNYLEVARIVEHILGKGSFRRLADEFAIENQRKEEEE